MKVSLMVYLGYSVPDTAIVTHLGQLCLGGLDTGPHHPSTANSKIARSFHHSIHHLGCLYLVSCCVGLAQLFNNMTHGVSRCAENEWRTGCDGDDNRIRHCDAEIAALVLKVKPFCLRLGLESRPDVALAVPLARGLVASSLHIIGMIEWY